MSTYQIVYDAFIAQGIAKDAAEQVARVVQKIEDEGVATKADIARLEGRIDVLGAEVRNLKWILGAIGFPMLIAVMVLAIQGF